MGINPVVLLVSFAISVVSLSVWIYVVHEEVRELREFLASLIAEESTYR